MRQGGSGRLSGAGGGGWIWAWICLIPEPVPLSAGHPLRNTHTWDSKFRKLITTGKQWGAVPCTLSLSCWGHNMVAGIPLPTSGRCDGSSQMCAQHLPHAGEQVNSQALPCGATTTSEGQRLWEARKKRPFQLSPTEWPLFLGPVLGGALAWWLPRWNNAISPKSQQLPAAGLPAAPAKPACGAASPKLGRPLSPRNPRFQGAQSLSSGPCLFWDPHPELRRALCTPTPV